MSFFKNRPLFFLGPVILSLLFQLQSSAQFPGIKELYTKIERMIPMRDGVKLFTAIYLPKDNSELHPILMNRTPYSCSPYGEDRFPPSFGNPAFIKEQYIFVFQDVRGRYMSQGAFRELTPYIPIKNTTGQVDESSDTYDTIEWLLKNLEDGNGRVGIHGISYPGFYATAALPGAHPALKAVSPQAPVTDEFEGDDVYHRGAFFLLDNASFLNEFDPPRNGPAKRYLPISNQFNFTDAYQFYLQLGPISQVNNRFLKHKSVLWDEFLRHDTKDAYWQARDIRPHLTNIKPAVLVVGGWFDAENLFGTLNTYQAIEHQNNKNHNYLLMGPWTHGTWARQHFSHYATYQFNSNTTTRFFEIEASFFNYYLKEKQDHLLPEATIFFTGSNEWRTFSKWPPPGSKPFNLYLDAGNQLSFHPVKNKQGYDEYLSDPQHPVPYSPLKTGERDDDYMGADQRFASTRPDVISFETGELNEPITLAGPVIARLFVSISETDADFVVKLVDVLPDQTHTQQLVRAEVIRGKFRNSFSKPQPFIPGKITPVNLPLNDVAHTFKTGHRIMVQVQSSWFPLVDRNPQTFINIPKAGVTDFKKATIRIERNARYQSIIECLQVLP